MLRSHVASCFWMGLPAPFCKSFLPKTDASIVVEDEDGEQYDMKYIARRSGLSGGWRRFAVVHRLREADVVVFQLVESCKFKVYIARANGTNEVDGTLDLPNPKAHTEHTTPDDRPSFKPSGRKRLLPLPQITARKVSARASSPQSSCHSVGPEVLESSRSHEPELSKAPEGSRSHKPELLNVSEGSRSDKPELPFEKVETFQDFRIVVDGQCVDSELPVDVRTSYYKLCMDRKELLHDGLPDGLYHKLVVGVIGQTVRIADEIQNCRSSTTKADFQALDNVLKSFELLGMKVGFLRGRIRTLVSLVFESERSMKARRLAEAREEQKRAVRLAAAKREVDAVVDGLKREGERCEGEFKEKAKAPW